MSRSTTLAMLLPLAALTACAGPPKAPSYDVEAASHETFKGQLDAEWFFRHIRGNEGDIEAVEIVYCPIINPPPFPYCRTAVVWERGKSKLLGQ